MFAVGTENFKLINKVLDQGWPNPGLDLFLSAIGFFNIQICYFFITGLTTIMVKIVELLSVASEEIRNSLFLILYIAYSSFS